MGPITGSRPESAKSSPESPVVAPGKSGGHAGNLGYFRGNFGSCGRVGGRSPGHFRHLLCSFRALCLVAGVAVIYHGPSGGRAESDPSVALRKVIYFGRRRRSALVLWVAPKVPGFGFLRKCRSSLVFFVMNFAPPSQISFSIPALRVCPGRARSGAWHTSHDTSAITFQAISRIRVLT